MKTRTTKGTLAKIEKSPISSFFTLRFGNKESCGFMTRFVGLEWILSQMIDANVSETEQARVVGLMDKELNRALRCELIVTT